MPTLNKLSRREKEILEVLVKLGEASAKEIQANLKNAPGNSSVRTHLKNLVAKGYANLKEQEFRYVYFLTDDMEDVTRSALDDVVDTFFKGEPALAVNQLLSGNLDEISEADLKELENMIKTYRSQKQQE